jgi:protein SCO1/2
MIAGLHGISALVMAWAILATPWMGDVPQSSIPAPNVKDVGFDQHLDAQVPLNLTFTDEGGKQVKLGDYFRGKPVILVLAYYRCPMLCTLVLNQLVDSMLKIPFVLSRDFDVITVSFDPREKPSLAAAKRVRYLERYGHPQAAAGWHFLTGNQDQIDRLTEVVGFRYVYDAKADQFIHPSGIMVLTPAGRISRYLFGIEYPGRDLRLALVEASASKIGTPAEQVLLYCFHYDPAAGKYTASVLNFIRLGGVLTVIALGVFVWLVVRMTKRHRAMASEGAMAPAALRSKGKPAAEEAAHDGKDRPMA